MHVVEYVQTFRLSNDGLLLIAKPTPADIFIIPLMNVRDKHGVVPFQHTAGKCPARLRVYR